MNKQPTPEEKEFEQQINNLIDKNYHYFAGLTEEKFRELLEPLRQKAATLEIPNKILEGRLPFVIVISSHLVPIEKMMSAVDRHGKAGFINLTPATPADFKPIDEVTIPKSAAYLLIDIDRGKETLNIPPEQALEIIKKQARSPLTIDEGIAILIHYPDFLQKNNCFSLLASRRGDKRIPALWLSENRPKLGWCWNGNPHTWLGSASCKRRVGY
jgi:hypothetical protein